MQTEVTALLILLLAIICVLKQKIIYNIIASLLISTLFFLKGVTLLYSVIVLIVMILNKNSIKQIIQVIIFSFLFLILELIVCYQMDKMFFIDLYLSTKYITESWESYSLLEYIMYGVVCLVCFATGLVSLCINTTIHVREKNKKILLLEIMVWVILFLGVYIQKLKYIYQIALMIPACLLSIMIIISYYKDNKINLNIYIKMIIISFLISVSVAGIIREIEATTQIHSVTQENEKKVKQLYEENPDLKNEEVLYIGNGLSAYYLKNKPYIRYTTTIYLSNNNQMYLNSDYVKQLKEKIKNYKGKYIIIDDIEWITKNRLSDDIIEFIENKYHYEKSTGIRIYETNEEIYSSIYVKD